MKVDIDMGAAAGGAVAELDLEELLATRLLVQGNSGSGKSHLLLRRLLEQSAPWVQQCIIDPEGDFVTLADKFGHLVIDAAALRERTDAHRRPRAPASRLGRAQSRRARRRAADARRGRPSSAACSRPSATTGIRCWWWSTRRSCSRRRSPARSRRGAQASLGAMTNLMCRGRKRGLAGVIATQRLAKLAKNVAAEASNFLMGRTFLDIDMARAADLLGMERRQAEMFRDLARGHFVALGPALSRRPLPVAIGPVETSARSASPKLTPLPEAPKDARELIFTPGPEEAPAGRAKGTAASRSRPPTSLAQLSRARPAAGTAGRAGFRNHRRGRARSRHRRGDARDARRPRRGFRTDAVLYQDFLVRCRIRRVAGEPLPLAGLPPASWRWRAPASMRHGGEDLGDGACLETLPDDLQGVFLMVARAATNRAPCPSDATLARAWRPTRRAGRGGCSPISRGARPARHPRRFSRPPRAGLPDLGCETLPGDPGAPDEAQRDAAEGGQPWPDGTAGSRRFEGRKRALLRSLCARADFGRLSGLQRVREKYHAATPRGPTFAPFETEWGRALAVRAARFGLVGGVALENVDHTFRTLGFGCRLVPERFGVLDDLAPFLGREARSAPSSRHARAAAPRRPSTRCCDNSATGRWWSRRAAAGAAAPCSSSSVLAK